MGTNYYGMKIPTAEEKSKIRKYIENDLYSQAQKYFPVEIHLGKSSAGWEFCFDHNNWEYFEKDMESVKDFIQKCEIVNEYGEKIDHKDFWDMVESKVGGLCHSKYMERWHVIHPGTPKPYYENEIGDFLVGDLRFSSHTDFS